MRQTRRTTAAPHTSASPGVAVVATPDGVILPVRVVPRAGRSGIAGVRDESLLVRLAAAPVDGAANAELIDVLAEAFALPRRAVSIVSGDHARQKRVRLAGATREAVAAVLAAAASGR